jgi:putative hydrolase of the HAD superfamily
MAGVIVLDLDDTLYLERDYARSGFAAVGEHLRERFGVAGAGERAWSHFEQGRRGDLFNRILSEDGIEPEPALVQELVDLYRSHRPAISLLPDAEDFIRRAQADGRLLALISDGPLAAQSAKAEVLNLARWFDPVILTDAWGRAFWKPHERAYHAVMDRHGKPADEHVYIGDNPLKDFHAPRRLGWNTIRVRRPQGEHAAVEATSHEGRPTHEADDLNAVAALLRLP